MDLQMLHYNALDCACTLEARNAFWSDMKSQGYGPAYQMTIDLYEPLMFMMTRGIRVDMSALEETKRDIETRKKEAEDEFAKICGPNLNPNSPKQLIQYFYVEKGIQPYLNKDGKITTDDKAMQRLARGTAKRPGLREASLIQTIRGLGKLYSTYLDINFDADSRLRCAYNPRGTKFGRLSSSETVFGTGTNQQNLPQEFKKFLVPDEGYFFLEVDKRQAEWVVVAYLSGDANMLDVIQHERDPHTHTASLMFNVPHEVINLENKLIGMLSDPDEIMERRMADKVVQDVAHVLPRTMSGRQCGKKSNHGLNYDEGYRTFALINEVEEREAKRIIELYHSIYPGIRNNFYEFVRRELSRDRTLTNCFGRKIRLLDAWGHELFKAAYSALPQSTVVDSLNKGMIATYYDEKITGTRHANVDLLSQVHDSILFQFPISLLKYPEKLMQLVHTIYKNVSPELEYFGRRFRIATDMKVGMNWSGYHEKANPRGMKEIKPWKNSAEFSRSIKGALHGLV